MNIVEQITARFSKFKVKNETNADLNHRIRNTLILFFLVALLITLVIILITTIF